MIAKIIYPAFIETHYKILQTCTSAQDMNRFNTMNQINRTLATISVLVLNVIILRKPGL